jgi:hypothetical protein
MSLLALYCRSSLQPCAEASGRVLFERTAHGAKPLNTRRPISVDPRRCDPGGGVV